VTRATWQFRGGPVIPLAEADDEARDLSDVLEAAGLACCLRAIGNPPPQWPQRTQLTGCYGHPSGVYDVDVRITVTLREETPNDSDPPA
jgi:hypothetical protein